MSAGFNYKFLYFSLMLFFLALIIVTTDSIIAQKDLSVSSEFVEFLLLNSGILWQSQSPCEPSENRKLAC